MSAATRATALLGADAPELLSHRFREAPQVHDLDPAGARVADAHLALDPRVVEQLQRPVHGGRGRRVAEAVRDEDPPVPVVLGVRLRVDRHQVHGRVHVLRLVEDPQVDREVGPVVGQRVDDALEMVCEAHCGPRRLPHPHVRPVQPENVWYSRNAFSAMIALATTEATTVVRPRLTSAPMTSRRRVSSTSGTSANGMPKERTTWLMTSERDGSSPRPSTASAGAIVTSRRSASGIVRAMKPCITT